MFLGVWVDNKFLYCIWSCLGFLIGSRCFWMSCYFFFSCFIFKVRRLFFVLENLIWSLFICLGVFLVFGSRLWWGSSFINWNMFWFEVINCMFVFERGGSNLLFDCLICFEFFVGVFEFFLGVVYFCGLGVCFLCLKLFLIILKVRGK